MAGIASISSGAPLTGPSLGPPVAFIGRNPSGALGTSAGLGETNSVGPAAGSPDESDRRRAGSVRQGASDLTEEEEQEVQELKQRDQEVRRHEQAHVAAAGRYAKGGPQYEFTTGPDGRQYATGGHVSIDVSPARTPEATLQKAQVVRRAALAPAEPSAQDRAVAAEASQLEANARREIQEARQAEADGGEGSEGDAAEAASAVGGAGALQPPPALPQRGISGYKPETSGGGGGVGAGVRQLDVLA